MKKHTAPIFGIICAVSSALLLSACGNGGGLFAEPTPTPMPFTDAASLITLDDAKNAVENKYELEMEGGGAVNSGNVSTVSYLSSPLGSGDPVIVTVKNRTSEISADDIWNDYESDRLLRDSNEFVSGIGEDAYIAYPSIHVYDRGCEIIITASSGSDDTQKAVLEDLAKIAASRIEQIMPEEPAAVEN